MEHHRFWELRDHCKKQFGKFLSLRSMLMEEIFSTIHPIIRELKQNSYRIPYKYIIDQTVISLIEKTTILKFLEDDSNSIEVSDKYQDIILAEQPGKIVKFKEFDIPTLVLNEQHAEEFIWELFNDSILITPNEQVIELVNS
jgi:hypothetical protein